MSINIHRIGQYLSDYALLGPAIVVTLALSLVVARRFGAWLRASQAVAWLVAFGLGLVISATLTPSRDALLSGVVGSGTCEITPIDLDAITAMFRFGDPAFNFLLFVPFGLGIGLLPRPRIRTRVLVLGILLSPAIELVQLVVTPLDRACQSSDVFDNLTGLIAGFAIGWIVRFLIEQVRTGDDRSGGPAVD